ncbi:hypothetical protein CC78DRAFT_583616 [Lojkania enalia]|uniref:Uncharacterized protein n=1 Tax=Lojkania enalia TaxID=147567 RepID=A0A9P4K2Q5_9PLEO|nr:hypothetical protein CC78DRAFT_583616 [Didymosphaeria enalia]
MAFGSNDLFIEKLQKMGISMGSIGDSLDFGGLETSTATHVVAGLTWGIRTIITAQHLLDFDCNDELDLDLPPGYQEQAVEKSHSRTFKVDLFTYLKDIPGSISSKFQSVRKFVQGVQEEILSKDGGKDLIPRDNLMNAADQIRNMKDAETELNPKFVRLTKDFKAGSFDTRGISKLLTNFHNGPASPKKPIKISETYWVKL